MYKILRTRHGQLLSPTCDFPWTPGQWHKSNSIHPFLYTFRQLNTRLYHRLIPNNTTLVVYHAEGQAQPCPRWSNDPLGHLVLRSAAVRITTPVTANFN